MVDACAETFEAGYGEAEAVGEERGDAYAHMQMVGHYDMAVDGDLRELALPLAEGLVYSAAGRERDGVGDGSLGWARLFHLN